MLNEYSKNYFNLQLRAQKAYAISTIEGTVGVSDSKNLSFTRSI